MCVCVFDGFSLCVHVCVCVCVFDGISLCAPPLLTLQCTVCIEGFE